MSRKQDIKYLTMGKRIDFLFLSIYVLSYFKNLTRWKDRNRPIKIFTKYPHKFKSTQFIPCMHGLIFYLVLKQKNVSPSHSLEPEKSPVLIPKPKTDFLKKFGLKTGPKTGDWEVLSLKTGVHLFSTNPRSGVGFCREKNS
jgi:hypothetical protein